MYPKDELLVAGVDVLDNNLYKDAIITFDNYIKEFRKIYKK